MTDANTFIQFGLGAALIGVFFVPYIKTLTDRVAEKDMQIKELNETIQGLQEKRLQDMVEVTKPMMDLMAEFNNTADALFKIIGELKNAS